MLDVVPMLAVVRDELQGTGSVGMLQQLVQITSGPGDGVLFAWRSFEAYPIMTQTSTSRRV